MAPQGFVVGGAQTGVGKTSVTLGLIRALAERGDEVQPYKVGPDFIDPGHHRRAAGRWSHNLDGWMLDRSASRRLFGRHAAGADMAIVEGVMGLFDGFGGDKEAGSTAQMAKWLKLPVVLVVDAWSLARSGGAMVKGYAEFDPALDVEGVIFNRVAGRGHLETLRASVESATDVEVLGGLPRREGLEIPERHLGLYLAEGEELPTDYIDDLGSLLAEHVDLERLTTVARPAPVEQKDSFQRAAESKRSAEETARIGVAFDEAFCFYYRDNFDRLEACGAELVPFSPLRDELPADLDALYFGGGYPELHAGGLADNASMRRDVRAFAEAGRPIYAECGGLMYLGEELETDEETAEMCGVFPYRTQMGDRIQIDYGEVTVGEGAPFFPSGATARGHLFHKSEIVEGPELASLERCYTVETRREKTIREGFVYNQVLASYIHLHFGSNPAFAEEFVRRAL